MVGVRVSLKLEASWDFFSRRIERCPKQIVLIPFLEYQKCNFIERKKTKTNKKATRACLKVCRKSHESTWNYSTLTSYERRQVLFLHDREAIRRSSHSPVDNCALFIRHQEYISQVTSYKYRLCSHSLEQSRRQYSFFSRSAKPGCGFKQVHNNLATEVIVFLRCSYFYNYTENPNSQ